MFLDINDVGKRDRLALPDDISTRVSESVSTERILPTSFEPERVLTSFRKVNPAWLVLVARAAGLVGLDSLVDTEPIPAPEPVRIQMPAA